MTSSNEAIRYIRQAHANALDLVHSQIAAHTNEITRLKQILEQLTVDDQKYADMIEPEVTHGTRDHPDE